MSKFGAGAVIPARAAGSWAGAAVPARAAGNVLPVLLKPAVVAARAAGNVFTPVLLRSKGAGNGVID